MMLSLCNFSLCFLVSCRQYLTQYNNMVCERNNYYKHKGRTKGFWSVTI